MSFFKSTGTFLSSSYDKLIALIVAILFIAALIWLCIQVESIPTRIAEIDKALEELTPEHPNAAHVKTEGFLDAHKTIANPFQMRTGDEQIFHHEPRILCSDCRLPIPVTTVQAMEPCPFCNAVPPPPPENQDIDNDKMWDSWEVANKLDPTDKKDAALDPDKDGFTNLEEFLVRSDPQEKKSSPLNLSVKVENIVRTKFKMKFTSIVTPPDKKKKFGINIGERTIFAAIGDVIDGYTLKSLDEESVENTFNNTTHTRTAPALKLEGHGKEITLIKDHHHLEFYTILLFTLDNSKHTVSSTTPLNLRGRQFTLQNIDLKKRSVTLKAEDTDKIWVFTN